MMKKLIVAAAVAALCVPAVPAMAQEIPTEPVAANVDWYMVEMVKFKPGKRERAHEIIDSYFIPVDQALGRSGVIDIHLNTGEWDSIVAFPMRGGVADLDWEMSPDDMAWMARLAQMVGGMEQAQAIFNEWDSLVLRSETHLGHVDRD
ncbi:MAG: hypothetical protein WBB01_26435 [Phormidesmis sp.]